MRAILIDPFTRTIDAIETDASLDDLYKILHVDMITVVSFDREHAMILDDEGLLKGKEEQAYFWVKGAEQPFAGRGLIVGDDYGENRAATIGIDKVREVVKFLDNDQVDPTEFLGWSIVTFA